MRYARGIVLPLLLWLCAVSGSAVEVAFEGRQVVFATPQKAVAVLVWFHGSGGDPAVEAGWFHGHGLVERGLAVAAPPAGLGWSEDGETLFAHRLCRELRQRLDLEPSQLILGGSGAGAAHAMRLATEYQGSLCAAAVLVRGGLGGRWRAAESDPPPLFGLYANANDRVVPIASMRTIERRLEASGYPTHFVSGLAEQAWGDGLLGLVEAVCSARGIVLAPPGAAPVQPLDAEPAAQPEPQSPAPLPAAE